MYNDLRINRNSLDMVVSYETYQNVPNRSSKIAKSAYHTVLRENKSDSKKV